MVNRYFKTPRRNLAIQKYLLDKNYPEAKCTIRKSTLNWFGVLKPTPLSKEYTVRVEYNLKRIRPHVFVYGNNLKGLESENFPHVFKIDKEKNEVEICLHLHNEFRYSDIIAETIIPWAQEWLFYYEIWLLTGEWRGGGHGTPAYD